MKNSKTLTTHTWAKAFKELEGSSVSMVKVIGWGNGAVISMGGAVLDYVDYLPGEAGVLLNFENGVTIKCGECEVFYE